MTHFPVLVCLPADTDLPDLEFQLSDVLEQWNENRSVPEYRAYIDGGSESFWWVEQVRAAAERHHQGRAERIRTQDPLDALAITARDPKTDPQQDEIARDATCAAELGSHPNWEQVVRVYNDRFYPYDGTSELDLAKEGALCYDAETGTAFEYSTVNPEGRWDWWVIGGRWSGYFIARGPAVGLIWGPSDNDEEGNAIGDGLLRCDGGPIGALDLAVMRDRGEAAARNRYQRWAAIQAACPPAKGWEHFAGLVHVGAATIDEARTAYNSQPAIAAARETGLTGWFDSCPIEEFLPGEDEYAAAARGTAVPGYALVTLEKEWLAPGEMGWFGHSTDGPGERDAYQVQANLYLDQLDPAVLVVAVDCHV